MGTSGPLFFMFSLGLFFLLFILSNSNTSVLYFILLYCILLLSIRKLFSNERQKKVSSDEWGGNLRENVYFQQKEKILYALRS